VPSISNITPLYLAGGVFCGHAVVMVWLML